MKWFGTPQGAPYESDCPRVPIPVGKPCGWCGEPIADGEDGLMLPLISRYEVKNLPYHYACHIRSIVGGLNHLNKQCTCCGGRLPPDPPGMTMREAAEAATYHWYAMKD